jgi:hypothetical protein
VRYTRTDVDMRTLVYTELTKDAYDSESQLATGVGQSKSSVGRFLRSTRRQRVACLILDKPVHSTQSAGSFGKLNDGR